MINNTKELYDIIAVIWALYPKSGEPYGYTEFNADGTRVFYVFRSRAESFDKANAIAILPYEPTPVAVV